ncbi:ABC transporter ATP-binding protein [Nocardioides pantholopis]|uniref:ABC transporter ATP-binding protein n=1 Tax=Nocardioides pantholopis TaxID=2483798 RepID=UPI000FDBBD56|nr:ATP-binding cassette domain-containing protein [Nocardioides pantholopis]
MLALEHVSKSYGSHRVLDDITLRVRPGELLGYVGSNGAGKTTSMRVALGITAADAGCVTLDGVPLSDDVRARVGYMPEERGLYPTMRIHQQLQFFAELRGVAPRSAAAAAAYWLDRLGLAERRDHRLESLSLGNQQRVQLAAALVHEPVALVLDEPFSGLDPLAVDVMAEVLLEEAARGIPVIFSSHQLDLVERICDRVAILRSGRIVAEGAVAELTGDDGGRHLLRASADPAVWVPELERDLDRDDVAEHVDGDAVILRLDAAGLARTVDVVRRHGELVELRPWRPSLAQVFRDVGGAA